MLFIDRITQRLLEKNRAYHHTPRAKDRPFDDGCHRHQEITTHCTTFQAFILFSWLKTTKIRILRESPLLSLDNRPNTRFESYVMCRVFSIPSLLILLSPLIPLILGYICTEEGPIGKSQNGHNEIDGKEECHILSTNHQHSPAASRMAAVEHRLRER